MAYAQAKIASTIQDKLTGVLENLAKLTVDLAQPDLKSEERAQVIKEIQEAKEGLNFNTKSGVQKKSYRKCEYKWLDFGHFRRKNDVKKKTLFFEAQYGNSDSYKVFYMLIGIFSMFWNYVFETKT